MNASSAIRVAPLLLLLAGCATAPASPPPELQAARRAYQRAATTGAAAERSTELGFARSLLEQAEQTFRDSPGAPAVADRAYLALREAERAEARIRDRDRLREAARLEWEETKRKAELRRLREEQVRQRALEVKQTEAERNRAREAARAKAAQALAALREVGSLAEGVEGIVLTIPDSDLFMPGTARLHADGSALLQRAAGILRQLDRATFMVQARAGGRPLTARSQRLALQRADRAREELVSAGLPPQVVEATAGEARGAPPGSDLPGPQSKPSPDRSTERQLQVVIRGRASPDEEDIYSGLLAR